MFFSVGWISSATRHWPRSLKDDRRDPIYLSVAVAGHGRVAASPAAGEARQAAIHTARRGQTLRLCLGEQCERAAPATKTVPVAILGPSSPGRSLLVAVSDPSELFKSSDSSINWSFSSSSLEKTSFSGLHRHTVKTKVLYLRRFNSTCSFYIFQSTLQKC